MTPIVSAAELRVRVAIEGLPQTNSKLTQFEGRLKQVSGASATATLEANVEGRGFEEFEAHIEAAKADASRPITQEVRAKVDKHSFTSTLADIRRLKRKAESDAGGGSLGGSIGGIVAPFGKLPTIAALASPELLSLAGAATAVAGSASEAALGVGALAVGGGGMATVGIAGIASVAAPAIGALKELTKAQGSYVKAVETYGVQSSEAETAGRKLLAAEKSAGKEAVAVVRGLDSVKERWESLSRPGRESFLGALSDGLDHLEKKLPLLSRSADRSTASMRHDFDLFLNQVTGKGSGFDTFIDDMTDLFVHEGPMITRTLADWTQILEHIAEAAGPSLEMVTGQIEGWSDGIERSTENGPRLRGEISGLVDQTESWVRLLGQGADLVEAIFGDGAGQGQRLVGDMTGKLEQWRLGIEADPSKMERFFTESVDTTRELGQILSMIIEQWFLVAKAMEPVDHAIHGIASALDSVRIGNISGLTVLLGAITGVKVGKSVLELRGLFRAYEALGALRRGEIALADVLAGREAAAAGEIVAANGRVVASAEAAGAAEREMLIANSSGAVVSTVPIAAAAPATGGAESAAESGAAGGLLGAGMSKLGLIGKAAGVAGGYFAAEFGAKAIEGITGADLLENQSLLGSLTHGFNTGNGPGKELDVLQRAAGLNFTKSKAQLESLEKTFHRTMLGLEASAALGLGGINKHLQTGLGEANELWLRGMRPWRDHITEAMEAAVDQIRKGMAGGEIPVQQGQKEINRLLGEIHLRKGDDPLGLASAAVKGFKRTDAITASGVSDWIRELGRMPPAARAQTIDATHRMLEAWAAGHPKLEHAVENLTSMEIQKFRATNKQLREGVRQGATGPIAEAFREAAEGVGGALKNIGTNTDAVLKALGANNFLEFQAIVLKPSATAKARNAELNRAFGRQEGGRVVPGVTEGDSVRRMVPPNTFYLNSKASKHFFRDGGHVPVVVEPGEIEFPPEAVAHIGLHNLMAMNEAVPRFADGGQVSVGGPKATATIGHAALERVVKAANRYIDAHRPKGGGVNVPAGKGTEMMDGHPVADWIWKILEAARRHGIDFTVSSGWRSDAEQTAIYESGVQPAAVPKSLGGPGSNHEGTVYPAGAVDISPGAEALDAWLEHSRWANTLIYAGAKDPVHFSHPHDGGYQRGGVVGLKGGGSVKETHQHILHELGLASRNSAPGRDDLKNWVEVWNGQPRSVREYQGRATRKWLAARLPDGYWVDRFDFIRGFPGKSAGVPKAPTTMARTGGLIGYQGGGYTAADVKARTGHISPTEVIIAELLGGFPRDARILGEGAGTVKGENNFTLPNNAQGPDGHIGLWSESPAFGPVAVREDPVGATRAAYRVGWAPTHSFYPAWGRWQAEQSGRDGAKAFGPEFISIAEDVLAGGDVSAAGTGSHGRPPEPKHVKGSYIRHPKGSTGRGGGTYAEAVHAHYKVTTNHLTFGALPDNIKGCTEELGRRRKQLREYRAALSDTEDNRVRHDLEVNVAALEDRIRKLKRQRGRLLRKKRSEKRAERVKARIGKIESAADFAAWTGPAGIFAREEQAFEMAEERASQAVALEPEEPRLPGSATGDETRDVLGQWIEHVLAPYVAGTESAAYGTVLGVEGSWRNSIIGAEEFAEGKIGGWTARADHLGERIKDTRERIKGQRGRIGDIQERIARIQALRRDHPHQWEKRRGEIPHLRQGIAGLQDSIAEERDEIPGFEKIIAALEVSVKKTREETLPEWERSLGGVQGLGRTHEILGGLPGEPGTRFGGDIFQTQMTIHELGLKVPNALASLPEPEGTEGSGTTERLELELELSRQANQRLLVEDALGPTLARFEASYPTAPPYMGAFAEGGVALVGEEGPELAHFPSGTRVHSAEDTRSILGGDVHVVVNGHITREAGDTRDPIEVWRRDPRFGRMVREAVRTTPRGLAASGPGRAFRP